MYRFLISISRAEPTGDDDDELCFLGEFLVRSWRFGWLLHKQKT
jgi:hypothetical protein